MNVVEDLSKKRLAILGLGKMGSILLKALLKQKLFLPLNSLGIWRKNNLLSMRMEYTLSVEEIPKKLFD